MNKALKSMRKQINHKNFLDTISSMAYADYRSFVTALLAFEKSYTFEEATKIYDRWVSDKAYDSILELQQAIDLMQD